MNDERDFTGDERLEAVAAKLSYAQFRGQQIAEGIRNGRPHFSLGSNLQDAHGKHFEFWTAGAAKACVLFPKNGAETQSPRH